ncbi:hypothetical protein [Grimontia kaedaensis]|nr:hypothetical protein [Grimontia kaedaensis]
MEEAVVWAAQAFCRRSLAIWRARTFHQVFKHQTISTIEQSSLNHRTLGALKSAEIISVTSKGERLVVGRDYNAVSLDDVHFLDAFDDVTVTCAVEPRVGSSHLPASLFNDWEDGICAGAAKRLLLQPDKDWSDVALAGYYEREFVEAIRKARRWRLEVSPDVTPENPLSRKRSFV